MEDSTTNNESSFTLAPALVIVQAEKDEKIRAVVGITCCLSIIGSVLIILSYLVQAQKTKAREILVHISLMDLGVGLSNLIGLSVFFNRFYIEDEKELIEPPAYITAMCKTQAFFAAYCTLSSIFWTTALAGYLYTVILCRNNPNYAVYFLRFCYFFCYGFAIMIALWLVLSGKLGFSPYDSSGWCSLIAKDPVTLETDYFVGVFANDLWIYLAILLIVIIYVALKSFLSNQVKKSKDQNDMTARKFWASMNFVDYKFILIPVLFVLLRMWTCIRTIVTEYAGVNLEQEAPVVHTILVYLSGIGDSGQGFSNAVLFILFTKSARENILKIICCRCCRKIRDSSSEECGSSLSASYDQHNKHLHSETTSYGSTSGSHHSLFRPA